MLLVAHWSGASDGTATIVEIVVAQRPELTKFRLRHGALICAFLISGTETDFARTGERPSSARCHTVHIAALADLRGQTVAPDCCTGSSAANECAELGYTTSALFAAVARHQVLLLVCIIYNYGARSGQKWWLLTTVQLEFAHEVNLLFHEFGLDLAPRDHSLAQMMTE